MSVNRRVKLALLLVLFGCVTAVAGGWLWYRWKYPYGRSHSCDKLLWFALLDYADDNGGVFPAGEGTPEASLSLLYPKYADAHVLSGKTVQPEVAQAILDRGELLGPETCGWHYVEGLERGGDSRLALFWDKARLGHRGERLSEGRTAVFFLSIGHKYISEAEWADFLTQHEELLKSRRMEFQQGND